MRPGTFWNTLVNSISNPKYYLDVLNVSSWFTIRFLIASYFLLALMSGVLFVIFDLPKLRSSLTSFLDEAVANFPDQQQISWTGLQLETTQEEPYFLAFPKLPDAQGLPPQLLELNTQVTDINQISQSGKERSLVVAGERQLFVSQPGGGWSDLPLTDILTTDRFTITKESLEAALPSYHRQLQTTLRALPFFFVLLFFLISFPLRVFNVVIDSIVIFFIVRLIGLPLGYKKVAQISLHVTVVAELLTVLTANITRSIPMFSLAFWGYTLFIYWNLRNVKALTPNEVERLNRE